MMMAPSTKSPWMRAVGPAALASSARMGDAMRHQRPSSAMQMEAEMTWAPSDGVYIYICLCKYHTLLTMFNSFVPIQFSDPMS